GVARERLPVRRDPRDAVPVGERPGRLLSMVGDGDELPAALPDRPRVKVLHPAVGEESDADRPVRPLGRRAQPFTPVSVTPSMNTFCARKNKMITGSMNIRDAAIVRFHCTWWRALNSDRPIASVQLF